MPRIRQAAASAGRPSPRVIVGLPVWLTDAPDEARATSGAQHGRRRHHAFLSSDAGGRGCRRPHRHRLVGDEAAIQAGLARLEHSGVTELLANVAGPPEEQVRTRAFLASLVP